MSFISVSRVTEFFGLILSMPQNAESTTTANTIPNEHNDSGLTQSSFWTVLKVRSLVRLSERKARAYVFIFYRNYP